VNKLNARLSHGSVRFEMGKRIDRGRIRAADVSACVLHGACDAFSTKARAGIVPEHASDSRPTSRFAAACDLFSWFGRRDAAACFARLMEWEVQMAQTNADGCEPHTGIEGE